MIIEWENRKWSWNPIDENLLRVNDWTYDFNKALPYIENKRVAIQAGGAMGMWPYLLSQQFDKVYTFEASKENYIHLEKNLSEAYLEFQYLSSPEVLERKVSRNIDIDYKNLNFSQIYLNFDNFINEQKKITKILINEKQEK